MAQIYQGKKDCLEDRDSDGNTALMRTVLRVSGGCENADRVEGDVSIHSNEEAVYMLINRGGVDINARNYTGDTALSIAFDKGSEDLVRLLIECGADCNEIGASEIPPLLTAVGKYSPSLAMSMVKAGAEVNATDDCGNTALTNVLKRKDDKVWSEEQLLKCVKVLTEHGADVNHTTKDNLYPLLIAVQKNIPTVVRHLLQVGAEVNRLDDEKDPILITAVETLSVETVSCLIDAGACVNSMDKMIRALKLQHPCAGRSSKRTAKTSAIDIVSFFRPKNEIARTLVGKGASLDVVDGNKYSPLILAIISREEDLLKMFIGSGANVNASYGNIFEDMSISSTNSNCKHGSTYRNNKLCKCEMNPTPLHGSLMSEWEPGFHILLNADADITVKDIHGNGVIHYAARCCNAHFLRYLLVTYYTSTPDQVEHPNCDVSLQRLGQADLNSRNVLNATPLHITTSYNKPENAVLLIEAGCDLNIQTRSGMSPLLLAITKQFDRVAQILIQAGADMNLTSDAGQSAFHLACKNNRCMVFNFLLKAGVNIQEINDAGQTVMNYAPTIEFFKELMNLGLDIFHRDYSSSTPLHAAAMKGNAELARFILSQGEDVNVATNSGDTPLILAVASKRNDVLDVLYDFGADANKQNNDGSTALIVYCYQLTLGSWHKDRIFYELFRFSLNLDMQDNSGCTALMYLSQTRIGVLREVQFLLKKEASVNIKNKEGKTALMYSIVSGFGKICRTLLQCGALPEIGELPKNTSFDLTSQVEVF